MHNNIITSDESKILKEHFKSQRPTKDLHPEFFNHRSYTTGIGYWWKKWYYDGAEFLETGSNEERVKFLEKMIEITS